MTELPPGWVGIALGDIGRWRGGGTPSKAADHLWRQGTIPWVSPKDMKTRVIEDAQDKLNEVARGHAGFKLVPSGSVLIVMRSGILQHTLPVAVTAREVAINQDLKALIPYGGINSRFIALQLATEAGRILETCVKAGTTVESIDFARLRAFPVRIAPTSEQARIVAKLEPLLSRCALVRRELARVVQLARSQRHAVLAAAFRGSLTGAERDTDGRPIGWKVVPLSSLIVGKPQNGLSPTGAAEGHGTLSLRLTATTSGELRLDPRAIKRVDVIPPPDSRYWLRPGDLLVQRANALEHVGASAIFQGEERTFIYPDLMMRIRIEDELTRTYVWRYMNSPAARRYFQEHATGTSGNMPKITGRILADLPVPLAPQDQMSAIVTSINKLYGRLEILIAENDRCLRLVDKLEKTFLRKAFDGRLVRQDPAETAATAILDSARVEREYEEDRTVSYSTSQMPPPEAISAYVERQLDVWPSEGITFEQLRADAPGSYEDLKDIIFELMEANRLDQRYDGRERKMKLVRLP